VIEHAQAHAGQACVQCPRFVFARDQHRLVNGIGVRQGQAVAGRFVAIGAAQQVDVALPECFYSGLAAGKTQHAYRQLQGRTDQVCIFGGEPLVVMAATGDVERRVVGGRCSQYQFLAPCKPLPLLGGELRWRWPGR